MKRRTYGLIFTGLLLTLTVVMGACSPIGGEEVTTATEEPVAVVESSESSSSSADSTAAEEESAYPAPEPTAGPTAVAEEVAYPPPIVESESGEEQAYPPPVTPTAETSSIPIVPFVLDLPIPTGTTMLTGTGPADVPILAVNVTNMGEVLGESVIDGEGNFAIAVPELGEGAWIGIALSNLDGTGLTFEDFQPYGFRGEGAYQVPQVGFVYDSATVGP